MLVFICDILTIFFVAGERLCVTYPPTPLSVKGAYILEHQTILQTALLIRNH